MTHKRINSFREKEKEGNFNVKKFTGYIILNVIIVKSNLSKTVSNSLRVELKSKKKFFHCLIFLNTRVCDAVTRNRSS